MFLYRHLLSLLSIGKEKYNIIFSSIKLILKMVIIDQLSKWWLINYLKTTPGMSIKVTSFLDIVYVWNYGISFGFFRQYYQYSNIVFMVISFIIIIYLYYIIMNCKSALSFFAYNIIVSGAIGNIIDRISRGAVFDFIHLHYADYSFPVFNIADSFISIGVAILLYDSYKTKKNIAAELKLDHNQLERMAEKIRSIDDEKYKT